MNTKEGKQLLKEVKLLFKDTPFYVSDDSYNYDWDDIKICLNVRDGAASLMSIFKVNTAQIYKNLVKIVKKYPSFKIVGADSGRGDFYDDDDIIAFIEIFREEDRYNDDLLQSFVNKFNGYVNLNEMAVFRGSALERNIHGFGSVLGVGTPTRDITGTKEKITGIMLLSDARDSKKIHFVLYVTQHYNNDDNPFFDLIGLQGTQLTRELRRIWEFEPSSVLYGGYVSLKGSLYDFDELSEKGIILEELLMEYIKSGGFYKYTDGFTKRFLTLNIKDLLY